MIGGTGIEISRRTGKAVAMQHTTVELRSSPMKSGNHKQKCRRSRAQSGKELVSCEAAWVWLDMTESEGV